MTHYTSGATVFVVEGGRPIGGIQLFNSAKPGDTIVLQAGAYLLVISHCRGRPIPINYGLMSRVQHLPRLPAPGNRTTPATDAPNMPKIVTPNGRNAITLASGGGYVRFVGVEMYSTSTYGANPTHTPWPVNGVYVLPAFR
jgi:hypothetical protein